MRKVQLNKEPVELFKLIKFEGLAQSGGEAKQFIEQEMVYVNGEIETRKRKKIVAGFGPSHYLLIPAQLHCHRSRGIVLYTTPFSSFRT